MTEILYTLKCILLASELWRIQIDPVVYNLWRLGPVVLGFVTQGPLEDTKVRADCVCPEGSACSDCSRCAYCRKSDG